MIIYTKEDKNIELEDDEDEVPLAPPSPPPSPPGHRRLAGTITPQSLLFPPPALTSKSVDFMEMLIVGVVGVVVFIVCCVVLSLLIWFFFFSGTTAKEGGTGTGTVSWIEECGPPITPVTIQRISKEAMTPPWTWNSITSNSKRMDLFNKVMAEQLKCQQAYVDQAASDLQQSIAWFRSQD